MLVLEFTAKRLDFETPGDLDRDNIYELTRNRLRRLRKASELDADTNNEYLVTGDEAGTVVG